MSGREKEEPKWPKVPKKTAKIIEIAEKMAKTDPNRASERLLALAELKMRESRALVAKAKAILTENAEKAAEKER